MTFATAISDALGFFTTHWRSLLFIMLPNILLSLLLSPLISSIMDGAGDTDAATMEQLSLTAIPPQLWFYVGLSLVVGLLCQLVLLRWTQQRVQGDDAAIAHLWTPALLRLPMALLGMVLLGLLVGFGFVMFLLPGIYLLVKLWFMLPILALEPVHPLDALVQSFKRTQGYGWAILAFIGVSLLAFLLGSFLVALVEGLLGGLLGQLLATLWGAVFGIVYLLFSLRLYEHQRSQA